MNQKQSLVEPCLVKISQELCSWFVDSVVAENWSGWEEEVAFNVFHCKSIGEAEG